MPRAADCRRSLFLLIGILGAGVCHGEEPDAFLAYGIAPVANEHSQKWTVQERGQMLRLLRALPASLRDVLSKPERPLAVYKNHRRPKLAALFGRGQKLNIQTRPQDGFPEPVVARQLLHYLLHRYEKRRQVGADSQWRRISGWKRVLGIWRAHNQDPRAYAYGRGLKSPGEDFITAAEYFILPPRSTLEASLKCRVPKKYAYLKNHFDGYRSVLDNELFKCRTMDHGFLDDLVFYDPISGKPWEMGPINEKTVTGFELLYATPGTGDASEIAGHLLLRIKLDNRDKLDERENPKDLVISFLANTDVEKRRRAKAAPKTGQQPAVKLHCNKNWFDLGEHGGEADFNAWQSLTQSLKGLSGGFLTIMDRQTLAQTIKNYTIEEDRNLLRYRLNLSTQQKQRLLQHLYRVKKNYKARYYFFNQNCASVLVKVIGQGLQDREIAEFNPVVSPPNTLLAMFVRKGLATPVFPSFYSYRKKGFLAQEKIKEQYRAMNMRYPRLAWPSLSGLFVKREKTRDKTLAKLQKFSRAHAGLDAEFYRMANYVQEAEMVYAHKDLVCENYTSMVTARARRWQKQLLRGGAVKVAAEDSHSVLNESHRAVESGTFRRGLPHTKLLAPRVRLGRTRMDQLRESAVVFDLALDRQEMGSVSNVAMQRSSSVELAAMQLQLGVEDRSVKTRVWRFTGLKLRKFKERLEKVPSYFHAAGTIGLGLTVADFRGDRLRDSSSGSWVAGSLLFNVVSSGAFEDFVFVSIGAALNRQRLGQKVEEGVVVPVYVETLMSFRNRRKWQWRNKWDYHHSGDGRLAHELDLRTELNYRLGRGAGGLMHLGVFAGYHELNQGFMAAPLRSSLIGLGLEINRW